MTSNNNVFNTLQNDAHLNIYIKGQCIQNRRKIYFCKSKKKKLLKDAQD